MSGWGISFLDSGRFPRKSFSWHEAQMQRMKMSNIIINVFVLFRRFNPVPIETQNNEIAQEKVNMLGYTSKLLYSQTYIKIGSSKPSKDNVTNIISE